MVETADKELWEKIKKDALEGFEILKGEVAKFTKELEKHGKVVKKKMDLSSIHRKLHQNFTQLGSRVYELVEDDQQDKIQEDSEFADIVSKIKELKTEVEAIEVEIENIKG
jgi:hypothetical protein